MFANKFYDFIWEINYSNNKKLKITNNKLIYIIFLFFFFLVYCKW